MSNFSASSLVNSPSSLSLSSHSSLESVSSDTPSLCEYKSFKIHTILPSIVNSSLRKRLGAPCVSITFAPDRRSGEDFSQFFEDTEYTKKNPSPPTPPAANSSGFTYEPLTRIQGYVSPKRADYFIWELGVFEEGSKVVLGDNLVLARITGIVGVKAEHECTRGWPRSIPTGISISKYHTWICVGFSHWVTRSRESKTRGFSSTHSIEKK